MTTYTVQAPDGKTVTLEGPPGASEADVIAQAQKLYQPHAAQPHRTLVGALAEAPGNIPKSAGDLIGGMASGIGTLVAHPIRSAEGMASGAADTFKGVMQQVRELSPPEFQGSAPAMNKAPAQAGENAVYGRYGVDPTPGGGRPFQKQNLYNTLATDPVGSAVDLSAVLAAPEAMGIRGTGMAGKVAGGLAKASEAINPITAPFRAAAAVAPAVGRAGGAALAQALGATTGAGATAVREAAKAGAKGGSAGKAFTENLRGQVATDAILPEAQAAVNNMRQARSAAYQNDIAPISQDPTILSFNDIQKAVQDVQNRGQYKGVDINPKAAQAWADIDEAVHDWMLRDPAQYHTAEGMDALKRKVGSIRDATERGTPARSAADAAYNAIKGEIVKQAPDYAKVMSDYEQASKQINDLTSALSLNGRANTSTTLTKLASLLKDDNTIGLKRRGELGRTLEDNGANTLFPAMAGQALSPALPRGLARYGDLAAGAGAAWAHSIPGAAAALAAASPRVVGEGAYAAGQASEKVKALAKLLSQSGLDPNLATLSAAQLSRALTAQGRPQ